MIFCKKVKTPTILQMEVTECGAASLGIILAYYGKKIPLEKLREDCGVSRDGSNAGNIVRAAQNYDCKVSGYSVDINELKKLKYPVILHWKFDHFVVFEYIKDNYAFINDPAIGHRKVHMEEFKKCFTGVILEIIPGSNFKKSVLTESTFSVINKLIKHMYSAFIFLAIAGILISIVPVIIAGISKLFFDKCIIANREEIITGFLLIFSLAKIFEIVLLFVKNSIAARFQIKFTINHATLILRHILKLPLKFFAQRYTGDIISRTNAINRLAEYLSTEFSPNFLNFIVIIFSLIAMLLTDVLISLCIVVLLSISCFILYMISARRFEYSRSYIHEKNILYSQTLNDLEAMETIKITNTADVMFTKWVQTHMNQLFHLHKKFNIDILYKFAYNFVILFATIIIFGIGGAKVIQGSLTIGDLIALEILFANINTGIISIGNLLSNSQEIYSDVLRLNDILIYNQDNQFEHKEFKKFKSYNNILVCKNLCFSFSPLDPDLIKGISFAVKEHDSVAIIGAVGSGKSTVAKLLANLYSSSKGSITYKGRLISEIAIHDLRKEIGYLSQDVVLFSGTIYENLTFFEKSISKDKLIDVIRDCCLEEFISEKGFEYKIEEGATNLSGGEKQRLELARIMLQQPKFLILDEATSALDSETESLIIQNLLQRNYTVMLITHRLPAIEGFDQIFVMQDGKIIEKGNHKALISMQGRYYELLQKEEVKTCLKR